MLFIGFNKPLKNVPNWDHQMGRDDPQIVGTLDPILESEKLVLDPNEKASAK
jgi:hypothetical protein